VSDDLRTARQRIESAAATVEGLRPQAWFRQGLGNLQLGLGLLLAFLFVQGLLSLLTGLALWILAETLAAPVASDP
jgi:hypothetical protein